MSSAQRWACAGDISPIPSTRFMPSVTSLYSTMSSSSAPVSVTKFAVNVLSFSKSFITMNRGSRTMCVADVARPKYALNLLAASGIVMSRPLLILLRNSSATSSSTSTTVDARA